MLSGIGAAAGFGLSWALLKFIMAGLGIYLDPRQRFLLSTVLVAAGVFCGLRLAGRPPARDASASRRRASAAAADWKNPWERDR